MRKTSACCRRGRKKSCRVKGFTLLELLLVLVLVGLATGLVAPQLAGRLQAAETRGYLERVDDLLANLPHHARQSQQFQRVGGEELRVRLGDLSDAYVLELPEPLQYDARGLAKGGTVILRQGDTLMATWHIEAPLGTVHRSAP